MINNGPDMPLFRKNAAVILIWSMGLLYGWPSKQWLDISLLLTTDGPVAHYRVDRTIVSWVDNGPVARDKVDLTISTWVDNRPVAHYRVDRTVGTWVDNGPGCYCRGRRYTAEYMGPAESAEAVMNVTTVVPFSGVGFVADARGPARAVPNDTLYAFCSALGTIHCSSTMCHFGHQRRTGISVSRNL